MAAFEVNLDTAYDWAKTNTRSDRLLEYLKTHKDDCKIVPPGKVMCILEQVVYNGNSPVFEALCRITGLWFNMEMVQRLKTLSEARLADPAIATGDSPAVNANRLVVRRFALFLKNLLESF